MVGQNKYLRLAVVILVLGLIAHGLAQATTVVEQILPITFTATLSGDQVVPPVDTQANGKVTAVLVGDLLVITGEYQNLSDGINKIVPAIVAKALPGENGSAVKVEREQIAVGVSRSFLLRTDGHTSGTLLGTFNLTDTQIQDLSAGLYYLQVNSDQNETVLRGQLSPTIELELSDQNLVGVWQKQSNTAPTYYQFKKDGTYSVSDTVVENLENFPVDSGLYQLDGYNITFITEENNATCPHATGIYTVMLTKRNQLHFLAHEDECSPRQADLTGSILQPMTP